MEFEEIITGNRFKFICDEYLDEDKAHIDISKKPKTIFLKTDWLEAFKQKVLPQIDYNFKLVTHNGDRLIPVGNFDLLEEKRLLKWYGMNCHFNHPKLQPIPIGIANEKWPHGNKEHLIEISQKPIHKESLCYSNFDLSTNHIRRPKIFEIIQTKKFIDIDTNKHQYKDYLAKLKSYRYVISPPGNSIDCHRIWESIYLGVIPIVEKHIAMEYFYDLPILFVDNFNDVTEDLLEKQYESILKKEIYKSRLSYYQNLIKNE
jgi:hypothetical protein